MSTLAARSAEEAVALDREALALLDTKLRALFVERERMAEASQHDQALDLAFLRVPMSPGPRGPQVAAPLVTSYRNDFRAWVQVLLETLKR
jgi:hypothetical protein